VFMSKQKYTLLVFAIIGILLLSPGIGVEFYDKVWSFPGNLLSDEFKNSFPIASIPLMVIALLGTGVYMTFKLGFPQLKHVLHGIRVTRGDYDDVEDDGDLNHFKALSHFLVPPLNTLNVHLRFNTEKQTSLEIQLVAPCTPLRTVLDLNGDG